MSRLLHLSGYLLFATACGCDPPHSGEDVAAMKAALLRVVPVGTTVADADARMRKLGYRVSNERNATFSENGESHHGIAFLYCTCSESAKFPVSRDWRIAVVYSPDGVTDVLVSVGFTGP